MTTTTGSIHVHHSPLVDARVAVIGAGIAGATVARCLKEAGVGSVSLFDKGRSVGGRTSSRLIQGYLFEFGTSLISEEPEEWLSTVLSSSLGAPLHVDVRSSYISMRPKTDKVCGVSLEGGVRQLVTLQARYADHIERSARISRVDRECQEWWLYGHQYQEVEGGGSVKRERSWGPFEALVIAVPSPQAAQLLFNHKVSWARQALKVRYEPSITLSVCFERSLAGVPAELPQTSSIMLMRQALSSSAHDQVEELTSDARAWVLQMSAKWSDERLDWEPEQIKDEIITALRALTGAPVPDLIVWRVHRWRYASPSLKPEEASGVLFDHAMALYVCGDWTSGPNGGWAFMSGREAAQLTLGGLEKIAT